MVRKLTLLLLFCVLGFAAFAQQTISGLVTDDSNNEPLIGVSVFLQGGTRGALTDIDGTFFMTLPESHSGKLVISYLGYLTANVNIPSDGSMLKVQLEQDAFQLTDIVVTANKKLETSQKVSSSISTLGQIELQRSGALVLEDYFASIPNLSQSASGAGGASFGDGRSSGKNIAIRGISGTNTTAMYLDETPLPEFADPRLFDVNRIEVLKGPQGTLYGSATMGGAVKVITNRPNAYKTEINVEGNVASVTEGDLDYNGQAVFNIPIVKSKLALRAGGFYGFRTGVYDRKRQTHFNGFPVNTSDGSQAVAGQILDDPTTDAVELFTDAPVELSFLATPEVGNAWADGETERNNVDDELSYGLNASLGFYPTENISIIPKVIIQRTQGSGYDFADISPDNFTQYRSAGLDESYELNLNHYSLVGRFKLKSGELVNSFSYSEIGQVDVEDVTEVNSSGGGGSTWGPPFGMRGGSVMPNTFTRTGDLSKLVEELRFVSDFGGKFNFTTGIFVGIEKSQFDVYKERPVLFDIIGIPGTPVFYTQDTDINTDEYAFFGELYYNITDNLKITGGFRFFQAEQDFNQLVGGLVGDFNEDYIRNVKKENGFNPKLNLTYNIDSDKLLYGGVTRGFRLGGGNPYVPIIFAGDDLAALGLTEAPATYDADYIWSYEVGSKNVLLNNRLILNGAIFHNVWNNLQQRVFLPSGYLFLDNVGSATITGLDFDLKGKISKNLQIGLSAGYADSKISEGSEYTGAEKGDRVLNVPTFTASGNIQYSHKVGTKEDNSMYYRVDFQHVGERLNTFDPENQPRFVFDPFTLFNARVGYSTPTYEIALFGRNIFNTIANFGDVTSLGSTPYQRTRYATSRPASFGLSVIYNFESK